MGNEDTKRSSVNSDHTSDDGQTSRNSRNPEPRAKPWWQWFFLYPAFGIALLTAMPQWMSGAERIIDKINSPKDHEETQLTKFMEKNKECVKAPFRWIDVSKHTKVDGTICSETGDVWLIVSVGEKTAYKGIEIDDIIQSKISSRDFFSINAVAAVFDDSSSVSNPHRAFGMNFKDETRLAQNLAVVICQKFEGSQIIRHVRVDGTCFNETINSQTGLVQSRDQVPCKTSC